MTFERFTDRARRSIVLAQEEARMLGHDTIGTEHLLLGLLAEGEGVASRALSALGITLETARQRVEERRPAQPESPPGHLPFTPRAKKVCELAFREALQLGHNYVGTEHLLLGIVREGWGAAAQALVGLGVPLDAARRKVIDLLHGYEKAGAAKREAAAGAASVPQPTEAQIIADLDHGIRPAVMHLRDHGIDTGSSCQGGEGHAYPHPVIGFGGDDHAGLQAVWLLEGAGWQVNRLRRDWSLNAGAFTGWEVELESCKRRSEWPVKEEADDQR